MLVFAGGAAGKFACGALAERLGVIRTVVVTEAATCAGIFLLLVLPLAGCLLVLPLVGIALNGTSSVLYGTVADLVASDRRARSYAIFYTVGVSASASAPFAYGLVSDAVGRPRDARHHRRRRLPRHPSGRHPARAARGAVGPGPDLIRARPPPACSDPRLRAIRPRPNDRGLARRGARGGGAALHPADRDEKIRLLDRLARVSIGSPRALHQLHETLCFLAGLPRRRGRAPPLAARPSRASPRACGGSGPRRGGSTTPASRGHSSTIRSGCRWRAGSPARLRASADIVWAKPFAESEIEETLSLLVLPIEGEAMSDEGGLGWRRWLRLAKGDERASDLAPLVELFDRAPLPPEARERLFDGLALSIGWRPDGDLGLERWPGCRGRARSFTAARGRPSSAPTARRFRPRGHAAAAPPCGRRPPPLAHALIDAARAAMATRLRELFAFSHANADDVLVADPGRGLRIALIGIVPRERLPLHGYYAYLVAQERRAGELRRGLAALRRARGRRERLRVVPARRVGVHRRRRCCAPIARPSACVASSSIPIRSVSTIPRRSPRGPSTSTGVSDSDRSIPPSSGSPGRRTRRSAPGRATGRRSPSSGSSPRPRSGCRSAGAESSTARRSRRAGSGRSSPAASRSGSAATGPPRSGAPRARWRRRSACATGRGGAPTSGAVSPSSRPSSR